MAGHDGHRRRMRERVPGEVFAAMLPADTTEKTSHMQENARMIR